MTWHLDHELADRYRTGALGEVAAFSVESHVLECDTCKLAISSATDPQRLDDIWTGIVDVLDRPRRRPIERALGGLGLPEHISRLLVMTPLIRTSWLSSTLFVLLLSLIASRSFSDGHILFLVMAPLVPVLGVVVAFGRSIDPLYEIGLASPIGGFRLMLIRTAAVLACSMGVLLLAGVALAEAQLMAAWILPAFAFTLLTLIISSWTSLTVAGGVVSALWLTVVAAVETSTTAQYATFGPAAQTAFAGLTLTSITLLLVRRQSFEHLSGN